MNTEAPFSSMSRPGLHRGIAGYEGAIAAAYAPMRVSSAAPGDRHRWAVQGERLGDLRLTRIFAEGSIRAHIPVAARGQMEAPVLLIYVERGAFQFEQGGQSAWCGPDSVVLMDAGRPLQAAQNGLADLLSVVFPAARLRAEVSALPRRCTLPMKVGPGASTVLREMMLCAWRERLALAHSGESLSRMFGKLIEEVFPEQARRHRRVRDTHLPAIRELISRELRSPGLSPGYIAERLGLSASYLYSLAREAGVSLHEEIMLARLEACRRALQSPAWAAASVTEIALDHGFQDPAHFSRRFKACYGCVPSALRRSARAAAPGETRDALM